MLFSFVLWINEIKKSKREILMGYAVVTIELWHSFKLNSQNLRAFDCLYMLALIIKIFFIKNNFKTLIKMDTL